MPKYCDFFIGYDRAIFNTYELSTNCNSSTKYLITLTLHLSNIYIINYCVRVTLNN